MPRRVPDRVSSLSRSFSLFPFELPVFLSLSFPCRHDLRVKQYFTRADTQASAARPEKTGRVKIVSTCSMTDRVLSPPRWKYEPGTSSHRINPPRTLDINSVLSVIVRFESLHSRLSPARAREKRILSPICIILHGKERGEISRQARENFAMNLKVRFHEQIERALPRDRFSIPDQQVSLYRYRS